MITKLVKRGNSRALIIPAAILKRIYQLEGQVFELDRYIKEAEKEHRQHSKELLENG